MSELKPCPFCGGEAITIQEHGWWVVCTDCSAEVGFEGMSDTSGCYGSYQTEAEAIAAWNTRSDTATLYEDGFYLHGRKFVPERTCHDIKPQLPYFKCDVCGMADMGGREIWISDGFYRGQKPNYCPNCGARVTPKNSEITPKVVSE